MTRIGGRVAWLAVPVGLGCLAVVVALAWLALPLAPAVGTWFADAATGRLMSPSSTPGPAESAGPPTDCRDLYSDALWTSLTITPDARLNQDAAAPQTTAEGFVQALGPAVSLSCTWVAGDKTIATTVASVASDAGAIAAAALPSEGFRCADVVDGRVLCELAAGETVETIEVGGGLWLSTLQTGWAPERYAGRVAERVWVG